MINVEEEKRKIQEILDAEENIKNQLMASLKYDPSMEDEEVLKEQTKVLDNIFRRLIAKANSFYGNMPHYSAALRAQNQCRQTITTLRALEKKTDRTTKTS